MASTSGRNRNRKTQIKEVLASQREPEEKDRATTYVPWAPNGYVAFRLILAARMCAALWSNITDCDETFNYWEPMHYLLNGYGFQTWEYSPAYALRSYAYIWLYAWPLKLHAQVFGVNKILHFYSLRCLLALVCTLCETYFYRAVCRQFGVNVGRLTLGALVFASGMFVASTAFLPSTFGMMTTMMAIGSWYMGNVPAAIFFTALGALVGWPFTGALGIPIAIDIVFRHRDILRFVGWSIVSLVVCLVPLVVIDSYYYGGLVVAPLNIIIYNVFTEHGPNIYGVEPWSYYFINGFLNFNIVFILAIVSLPIVMLLSFVVPQQIRNIPLWLSLSPMYVWILIFFTRPHKEERFMFPIFPLFCLLAAVLVDYLQRLYCHVLCAMCDTKHTHYTRPSRWLPSLVGVIYAVACLSRTLALFYGYHAPLDVYGELHQRATNSGLVLGTKPINVCVGKEWYRFPSNYFLPNDNWQLQFVKSKFSGQLPKPFSSQPDATRIFPAHMNDANLEEPTRYVNVSSCHYLVDVDVPDEAEFEPRYVLAMKDWQVLLSAKFLDNPRSDRFFRAFFIPFVSTRYVSYVNYNILLSTHVSSKLYKI